VSCVLTQDWLAYCVPAAQRVHGRQLRSLEVVGAAPSYCIPRMHSLSFAQELSLVAVQGMTVNSTAQLHVLHCLHSLGLVEK